MIKNGYATLAEFKEYGIANASLDREDDLTIEKIINGVSRYIDDKAGRYFFPRVETRYYSVTSDPQIDLDEDLLEVITLTNGEGTAIVAASYNLLPRNASPKYAVRLLPSSNVYWQQNSSSDGEYVIPLVGFWGYREFYSTQGWKSITTINEGAPLAAADTTITMAATASLDPDGGQIIKIENELMHTVSVTTLNVVVERGANGSTAAIHADTTAVYLWQPQPDINEACLEIVNSIYKRRTGENVYASTVITGGGILVTPRDVPDMAADTIKRYARIV